MARRYRFTHALGVHPITRWNAALNLLGLA